MPCNNCVPELSLGDNCIAKPAGGAERTIWYVPMCKLAEDPFAEQSTPGIVTDILLLDGAFFRPVACLKDSIVATYVTDDATRMVTATLSFQLQPLGMDADRAIASADARGFLQALIDYNEQMCFVVEERRNSRNVAIRKVFPALLPEPFSGTSGAKAEDLQSATLTYKSRSDSLPLLLDSAYLLPTSGAEHNDDFNDDFS